MSATCAAKACSAPSNWSRTSDNRVFFDPARKVGPSIAAALLKRGVIARAMPQGDIIGFAPPLCLADTIVSATADALKEVCG
jgi:L-2,4-diaminobutyrate transaminase